MYLFQLYQTISYFLCDFFLGLWQECFIKYLQVINGPRSKVSRDMISSYTDAWFCKVKKKSNYWEFILLIISPDVQCLRLQRYLTRKREPERTIPLWCTKFKTTLCHSFPLFCRSIMGFHQIYLPETESSYVLAPLIKHFSELKKKKRISSNGAEVIEQQ